MPVPGAIAARPNMLPDGGLVWYNGYLFPTETKTRKVGGRFVYDQAQRTVAYVKYNFELESQILFNDLNTIEIEATVLRKLLSEPGKGFAYAGRGFGMPMVGIGNPLPQPPIIAGGPNPGPPGLYVNIDRDWPIKDVNWGPKPRVLDLTTRVGDRHGDLTWAVEVSIPECFTALYRDDMMEFNYEADFKFDYAGYATVTWSGYLTIPLSRIDQDNNGRILNQAASKFVNNFTFGAPGLRFRREQTSWKLSPSKTRLDFSYVDTQIPKPLPQGAVIVDATHQINNPKRLNYSLWHGTITATYEMVNSSNGVLAYQHFVTMVFKRLTFERNKLLALGFQAFPIPTHFSASEPEMYGRKKATFTCNYMVPFANPDKNDPNKPQFDKVFRWYLGSLFTRDPALKFDTWRDSMVGEAWAPTGNLFAQDGVGTTFDPAKAKDLIVDLCELSSPGIPVIEGTGEETTTTFTLGDIDWQQPTREGSWLAYHNTLVVEPDSGVIEHRPLPKKKTKPVTPNPDLSIGQEFGGGSVAPDPVQSLGEPIDWNPGTADEVDSDADAQPTVFQRRMGRRDEIVVVGWALRAGYPIQVPIFPGPYVRAENRAKGDFFQIKIVGDACGCPIYIASWQLRFKRINVNQTIDIPNSPYFGRPSDDLDTTLLTVPDETDGELPP